MHPSKSLARFAFLTFVVLLAFPLRAAEPASAPSAPPAKMTLTIDGKPILPTNGTVAGVWFFADFDHGNYHRREHFGFCKRACH